MAISSLILGRFKRARWRWKAGKCGYRMALWTGPETFRTRSKQAKSKPVLPPKQRGLHQASTPASTTLADLGWLKIQLLYWKYPLSYQRKYIPSRLFVFVGMRLGAILHEVLDRVWSKTVLAFACTCTHPCVRSRFNSNSLGRGWRWVQVPL